MDQWISAWVESIKSGRPKKKSKLRKKLKEDAEKDNKDKDSKDKNSGDKDDKSKTRTKLVEWLKPKHVWLDKSQKDATSAKLFV